MGLFTNTEESGSARGQVKNHRKKLIEGLRYPIKMCLKVSFFIKLLEVNRLLEMFYRGTRPGIEKG